MTVIRFSYFRTFLGIHLSIWLLNLAALGIMAPNQLLKFVLMCIGLSVMLTRYVDKVVLCIVLAMLGVTLVSAVATPYTDFSVSRYLSSLFALSAVLFQLPGRLNERDRHFLLCVFAWAPVASVCVGFVYDVLGIWPLWYQDFLGVVRLQGSNIPAGLGGIGYIGVVGAFLASAFYDRRYLLLGAVDLVILALSAARMGFAAASMCAVVIIYYYHARSFSRIYFYTVGLLMVCFLGFVFVGDRIAARFESDSESGRDLIWQVLQDKISEYPNFGIGLGHQITIVPEDIMEKTATMAAHNEYLRLGVEMGYIGVSAFMFLFASIFLYMFLTRKNNRNPVFITIVSSFFIYCYTDNIISSLTAIFVLVMACNLSLDSRYRSPGRVMARPCSRSPSPAGASG